MQEQNKYYFVYM